MSKIPLLSVPVGNGAEWLREWVAQQLNAGVPRGVLSLSLLRAQFCDRDDFEEIVAIAELQHELESIMVERNLRGRAAEKAGAEAGAVQLYEDNIADWFDGSHPYERLRIIYGGEGLYAEAIRICEVYLDRVAADPKLCADFEKWIVKYRERLDES
jgi:hypothetical protein